MPPFLAVRLRGVVARLVNKKVGQLVRKRLLQHFSRVLPQQVFIELQVALATSSACRWGVVEVANHRAHYLAPYLFWQPADALVKSDLA